MGDHKMTFYHENFRILSVLATLIFLLASIFVLIKIEIITNFPFSEIADVGTWVFTIFLALNTLANTTSKNQSERRIMTPLSLTACIGFFILPFSL